jgi:hypothetical protein
MERHNGDSDKHQLLFVSNILVGKAMGREVLQRAIQFINLQFRAFSTHPYYSIVLDPLLL